jgi:hypothetical protein
VAKETLANLALSVVQSLDEGRLRPTGPEHPNAALPPRMMLALLTCGYAMGLYSSQDLAGKISEDEILQYLCAGKKLDRATIRRFRNRYREVIARCLEMVCLVVWKIRFGHWQSGLPLAGRRILGGGHRFDPFIQIEIKCDVMERLHRAEIEDNWGPSREAFAA